MRVVWEHGLPVPPCAGGGGGGGMCGGMGRVGAWITCASLCGGGGGMCGGMGRVGAWITCASLKRYGVVGAGKSGWYARGEGGGYAKGGGGGGGHVWWYRECGSMDYLCLPEEIWRCGGW